MIPTIPDVPHMSPFEFEFERLWRAKRAMPLWRRGRRNPQTAITHFKPLPIHFSVALETLHKEGETATSGLFASASFPLPTTLTEFLSLAFHHRRSIVMYSLILLLLCVITQIAASEAFAHGRYPRFNRVNDPNVSISTTISNFAVPLPGSDGP